MNLFKRFSLGKEIVKEPTEKLVSPFSNEIKKEEITFSTEDLLSLTIDGVLDTTSYDTIQKYKHNLKILIKNAKQNGKIDKFMLIRDEDHFPVDWKWHVYSNQTFFKKTSLALSVALRKQYALEKDNLIRNGSGITEGMNFYPSENEIDEAMKKVDKSFGQVLLPEHFRSTKHFTLNKPLEVTGSYNQVDSYRNFVIIDTMDAFLDSGYGYSISDRDAYLDVTHESLPISSDAIVLIEKSKFEKFCKNSEIMRFLKQRKIVVYKGEEEFMAINMVLTELGVLPYQVGPKWADYDSVVDEIYKNSFKELAIKNHLLYDQIHGGSNGHFSYFLDLENEDYDLAINDFISFLKTKFPAFSSIIDFQHVNNKYSSESLVKTVGTQELLQAINEYNFYKESIYKNRFADFLKDRNNVTLEVSQLFKNTVKRIRIFYENGEGNQYSKEQVNEIMDAILHFYQDKTVEEQLRAAKRVWQALQLNLEISPLLSFDDGELKL